ncbi:break repair meiotic recombinase recruitment factor 1 isoform X6 [Acinonyx jubatus]|uniref:Break repair meiotic recombinase recruitment factor 1 isoform X6 n=1 Tax=Acinonyx jubatus TaxID=32536 RepID=A0ABM3PVQ6_ACIJB|nr:break repair meiotic recombinase recruitment factor 1 isoform X6 [Acinonyx jubatus]XP_053075752.1 break repair meiotic recombinase recruitment factor 1 isoform X6 [Acinonyx jubatus]
MRGKEVERARRSRQTYPVPDKDRGTLTTSVAQISQRRDKMTKRKKLRTSGGEGIRPPKLPKNPRLGDSGRPPQSSEWGCLCLSEASEGRSGPVPSAEQRTEEPVQAASSSPAEEAQAPASLLGEPEKEPAPLPLSQNSARRFVPQFAKSRKIVTRPAELREEDLRSGTPKISQETPPGPSSQQARSRLQEESLGLASWEARELGAQTQPLLLQCTEKQWVALPRRPGPATTTQMPLKIPQAGLNSLLALQTRLSWGSLQPWNLTSCQTARYGMP